MFKSIGSRNTTPNRLNLVYKETKTITPNLDLEEAIDQTKSTNNKTSKQFVSRIKVKKYSESLKR